MEICVSTPIEKFVAGRIQQISSSGKKGNKDDLLVALDMEPVQFKFLESSGFEISVSQLWDIARFYNVPISQFFPEKLDF